MSRRAKKPPTGYIPVQSSVAFKTRLAIGGAMASALEPKMTLREVGKKLGLSATMVSRIERLALAKVAAAMKERTI